MRPNNSFKPKPLRGLIQALALMRQIALAVVLLAAGFIAGYVYSERTSRADYLDQHGSMIRGNSEMSLRLALMNIGFAQDGKKQDALRTNCFVARSSLNLVEPSFYDDPQKQKEVANLVSRARSVIATLESSDTCSGPRREG